MLFAFFPQQPLMLQQYHMIWVFFVSCLLKLDIPLRPELFDFHGVSMTHHYTDNWEKLQNFQARPDDVLIAAYPRSGQSLDMNRMCFAW